MKPTNCHTVLIGLLLLSSPLYPQEDKNKLKNPILNMQDGAVERFMGYYYAMGGGTAGKIYTSKNMVSWGNAVQAINTNEATWLNDPQWTQRTEYKSVGAGDILYRNGVFHAYWNGIGHAYSATPSGAYKEGSITAPFDDYGIDVQVFQDENGDIYWVKKRNPSDPHPMTGAASDIDGPEIWVFKMNSPFSRWDITVAGKQLSHQRGHPTSVNHINFEGPEMLKYRDRYYILYASNRMGPRSGMYEVGVAESDQPMNFSNSKKYPHPVLARNTEQHLLNYNVILNTAEHGGWTSKYRTATPPSGWTEAGFDDSSWTTAQGGYGRQEYDLFGNTGTLTNAKIRARKTVC
ncbi:MAG: family 43 glycosylhydrolase, partial [Prevotella sp.]|nr:family 43 glycosylhydrolase [Prevotella sp.]